MRFVDQQDIPWTEGEGYRKKILLRDDALNAPGTLVQIVEIAPGTEVDDHHHESCTEVFHILEGQGSFDIDGKTFNLSAGDTLTCEPREVHNTKNPHDAPFTCIVFKTNMVDNDLYWDRNTDN
ncbi:MAG: cupin domain-containing protein [Hyphomicrobiales bacterium]|nr:cupin domain-containing protein [Hyphomicrobiales bacterium]MCP5001966.1 cupin domain-containing protein [Hyphomicrobiales bacterium]